MELPWAVTALLVAAVVLTYKLPQCSQRLLWFSQQVLQCAHAAAVLPTTAPISCCGALNSFCGAPISCCCTTNSCCGALISCCDDIVVVIGKNTLFHIYNSSCMRYNALKCGKIAMYPLVHSVPYIGQL